MGRSHVTPIQQPDDTTCGPTALKHALAMFGKRKSLEYLMELCATNRNGTSTKNMIRAANKLGFSVLIVEYATLHHLQSALKYNPNQLRAVLVSYLYDLDEKDRPHADSGHWAAVSSYSASKSRIVLFDSSSAQKKSYDWADFRSRWMDFDLKRRKYGRRKKHFRLIRKWQQQLLFVMAKNPAHLPKFTIDTSHVFTPEESVQ
jgi:ABC-type bacteriocin/lantibiotic exporter with double-glycine peptidase domain